MQNMLMGRYIPGNSLIHRLDPRSKLLVMFIFVIVIFFAHDWLGYLLLILYTFAGVLLSGISIEVFIVLFFFFYRKNTNIVTIKEKYTIDREIKEKQSFLGI